MNYRKKKIKKMKTVIFCLLIIITSVGAIKLKKNVPIATDKAIENKVIVHNKKVDNKDERSLAEKKLRETIKKEMHDVKSKFLIVNKEFPIDINYVPEDLCIPYVMFSTTDKELKHMRKEAADALQAMFEKAESEGVIFYAVSGYRSGVTQKKIYEEDLISKGITKSDYVAYPGKSEHQTGLTMDVSCKSERFNVETTFKNTIEGKWLKANCYKYGFIIRYPEDKEEQTGYPFEPWHVRYVGTELAKVLKDNGLTMEEYYKDIINN